MPVPRCTANCTLMGFAIYLRVRAAECRCKAPSKPSAPPAKFPDAALQLHACVVCMFHPGDAWSGAEEQQGSSPQDQQQCDDQAHVAAHDVPQAQAAERPVCIAIGVLATTLSASQAPEPHSYTPQTVNCSPALAVLHTAVAVNTPPVAESAISGVDAAAGPPAKATRADDVHVSGANCCHAERVEAAVEAVDSEPEHERAACAPARTAVAGAPAARLRGESTCSDSGSVASAAASESDEDTDSDSSNNSDDEDGGDDSSSTGSSDSDSGDDDDDDGSDSSSSGTSGTDDEGSDSDGTQEAGNGAWSVPSCAASDGGHGDESDSDLAMAAALWTFSPSLLGMSKCSAAGTMPCDLDFEAFQLDQPGPSAAPVAYSAPAQAARPGAPRVGLSVKHSVTPLTPRCAPPVRRCAERVDGSEAAALRPRAVRAYRMAPPVHGTPVRTSDLVACLRRQRELPPPRASVSPGAASERALDARLLRGMRRRLQLAKEEFSDAEVKSAVTRAAAVACQHCYPQVHMCTRAFVRSCSADPRVAQRRDLDPSRSAHPDSIEVAFRELTCGQPLGHWRGTPGRPPMALVGTVGLQQFHRSDEQST